MQRTHNSPEPSSILGTPIGTDTPAHGTIGVLNVVLEGLPVLAVGLGNGIDARAGEHGRSAEAEHRSILTAALLHPPRRKLADLLASMPDVGRDDDFARQPAEAANTDGFG
jgi:plasmid stability protein